MDIIVIQDVIAVAKRLDHKGLVNAFESFAYAEMLWNHKKVEVVSYGLTTNDFIDMLKKSYY